jgi:hypothetical protein
MALRRPWRLTGRAALVAVVAGGAATAELLALNAFAMREIVWAYPIAFDQLHYALQAFRIYQGFLDLGFTRTVIAHLTSPSPQGVLVQLQGALLSLPLGPGWLRLLNVNFLYFLLLQAMTAYAAWYVGGRRARWALLALGLTLSLGTPYFWAGGVMDFRLDFAAFCLYGTLLAIVIRSEVFVSTRWALVAGVVAALLVCARILTLIYLTGVVVGLAAYLLMRRRTGWARQVGHLGMALCVFVAIVAPVAALQIGALYGYYWIGHVAGAEPAIRAQELGLAGLRDHLSFYPRSLVFTHLGSTFLVAAGAILLVSLGARRLSRPRAAMDGEAGVNADMLVVSTLCLIVPMLVLVSDVSKSPVVVGIVAPAAGWLVILGAMRLGGQWLWNGPVGMALAVLVLIAGIDHTARLLTSHLPSWGRRSEIREMIEAYDHIRRAALQRGDAQPRGVSVFGVSEYLRSELAEFLAYDRHRVLLNLTPELGHSIYATNLDEARAALDRSVFVITASERPPEHLVYPFDRAIQPMIPALTDYVRQRFTYLTQFTFRDVRHEVYWRPVPNGAGVSGVRVTRDGIVVEMSEAGQATGFEAARTAGRTSRTSSAGRWSAPAGLRRIVPRDRGMAWQ